MKRFLLTVLLGALLATPLYAQEKLQQAESFYRAGQYAQALSVYEQDLKNNPKDPYLYYNIGNCYFKMGSKGLAAAYYYRAFKLRPQDADIRHNLSLALASGGESLIPNGMPPGLHKALFVLPLGELKGLT